MNNLSHMQQLVLLTFVLVIPIGALVWASLQVPPSSEEDDTDEPKGP